jgi:chromosome segregation ATPase
LTTAKHALSETQQALGQYESEMKDLVVAKTKIECVIADYSQAGEVGASKRKDATKELKSIEKRIGEVTERLEELGDALDGRHAEEREAKDV